MTDMDEDTRLKLIGLKALADDHAKHMDDIYRVICATLGFDKRDDTGEISDWLWGDSGDAVERIWERTGHHRKDES